MSTEPGASTIPAVMQKSASVAAAYSTLLAIIRELSDVQVQEKKTSIHLVAGRAAFLGIHPRSTGIRINIVLARPLPGERVVKSEQVSKSRWHNEVELPAGSPIDMELEGWIHEAYELQKS